MTTNRSAAPATIFSRVWAPPPPLTSQPSGATWSAPSMVRSNRSMLATSSILRPSSRAACSVRGDVAAHTMSSDRWPGPGADRHGRAGAQPDGHAVLDQLRGRLRGDLLLSLDAHGYVPPGGCRDWAPPYGQPSPGTPGVHPTRRAAPLRRVVRITGP